MFFNDVFVPDDDVVGPVDGGWTVARATLGNESVSIGGGDGGMTLPADVLIASARRAPRAPRRRRGPRRPLHRRRTQAMGVLNLRSAHRAVAGGEPGPEGTVTKLVLSENGHEAAAILVGLAGPDAAFLDGDRRDGRRRWCSCTGRCRSPAARRRSSATRSASASSASPATR